MTLHNNTVIESWDDDWFHYHFSVKGVYSLCPEKSAVSVESSHFTLNNILLKLISLLEQIYKN